MTAPDVKPAGEEQKNLPPPRSPQKRGPRVPGAGREAKRLAAAILEVWGGVRSPAEAAAALKLNLPRYYFLEARALAGLVAACEPKPHGRVRSPESELAKARREGERWQRESARFQALARTAQRAVGLSPPPPPKVRTDAKGRRRSKHKPFVRALKVADVLKAPPSGETEAGSAGAQPAKG